MGGCSQRPTKTLFVVNFDPIHTRVRDLENHFEPYGKLLRVQIRKKFAFVQYETQEEATKVLECTNMSKVMERVITVEYAAREDGEGPGRGPAGDSRHTQVPDHGVRGLLEGGVAQMAELEVLRMVHVGVGLHLSVIEAGHQITGHMLAIIVDAVECDFKADQIHL